MQSSTCHITQSPLLPDLTEIYTREPQHTRTEKRRGADKLPRFVRAEPDQISGDPTPHHIAICEALYSYRLMTSDQIKTLLFATNTTANQTRRKLTWLFHTGHVYRKEKLIADGEGEYKKDVLYYLEQKGLELVAGKWQVPVQSLALDTDIRTLSPYHMRHRLLCHDIRIAITTSVQAHGLQHPVWKDEKTLKREHHADPIVIPTPEGTKKRTWVEPDGYFYLEGQTPNGYIQLNRFLEMDCGTESGTAQSVQKRAWNTKILAYLSYYRAGKFQQRYKAKGMTILTITTGGEGRLATLKAATEAASGQQRFWFTTLERLHGADILTDPVWSVASRLADERRSIIDKTVYQGPAGPDGPPLAQ